MNKLAKIESSQLEEVVKNSGLQIQEGEEIKQSYLPFLNQLAGIQDESTKINFENPSPTDEMIARDLRLRTVKIRTGAGDLKDGRKRIYLLRGNLEQAAYNLISASCKLAEEVFTSVEKAREIAEAKRKQEQAIIRQSELEPYLEFLPFQLDLVKMDEESYQKVLSGAKLQAEYKIQQLKKAEEERIAREKEQERIRQENEKLRKEAEAKEMQLQAERKAAEVKAAEEKRKSDEKLLFERKKAEELAEKERKEAAAKLRIEQEKAAKLQSEIKAKQEAEIRAKKEAEAKVQAEIKAKELADKKAQSAPDKVKLIAFSQTLKGLNIPEMKSDEGVQIISTVRVMLAKIHSFIDTKTNEL